MARKYLIAHLAHVEIITPKLEESANFFKELIGMEESDRQGYSVYLRCWDLPPQPGTHRGLPTSSGAYWLANQWAGGA